MVCSGTMIKATNGAQEFLFNFPQKPGPLSVTFNELMVGSPLSKFDLVFSLQALSITFNTGPVESSGGFVKVEVGAAPYTTEKPSSSIGRSREFSTAIPIFNVRFDYDSVLND